MAEKKEGLDEFKFTMFEVMKLILLVGLVLEVTDQARSAEVGLALLGEHVQLEGGFLHRWQQ